MTPTNEFRWLEREVKLDPFCVQSDGKGNFVPAARTYRKLQQKWFDYKTNPVTGSIIPPTMITEWRDVPVVKEGEA